MSGWCRAGARSALPSRPLCGAQPCPGTGSVIFHYHVVVTFEYLIAFIVEFEHLTASIMLTQIASLSVHGHCLVIASRRECSDMNGQYQY